MTDARLDDDSAPAWFAEFRRQSFDPGALGDYRWHKDLKGGLSGARVTLCLSRPEGADRSEPLILKRGPLDQILHEANARHELAEQGGAHQQEQLKVLTRRGASHLALRPAPDGEGLFGIIAYPFAGTLSDNRDRISDFETFIQDAYVASNDVSDKDLRFFFTRTAPVVAPPVTRTTGGSQLIDLPDLRDIMDRFTVAQRLLARESSDAPWLDALGGWVNGRLGDDVAHRDSRTVHGDPRFANIVLDRTSNTVTLIDYGEGRSGHVFHDLVRFEVDVLLRSTPVQAESRIDEIRARARVLAGIDNAPAGAPRALRVAGVWRAVRNEHLPALMLPAPFALYSMFVMNELFRRAKWHASGNTAEDVGATLDEILAALRVVTDAVVARDLLETEWRGVRAGDLKAILDLAGVDSSSWGTGETKTLDHLLGELRSGDCELVVDEQGLARRVRNVWVDVFCTVDGQRRHLVERHQHFTDGRERKRDLPASLGEKCTIGENPEVAARRALAEELGIPSPRTLASSAPLSSPSTGSSFPGLRTVYETYWFSAELDPDDYRPEGYVEQQSDKRTVFEWE